MPAGMKKSSASILNEAGYRLAISSPHPLLQVWINLRFRNTFEKCHHKNETACEEFTCSAHNAMQKDAVTKTKIVKAVWEMPR